MRNRNPCFLPFSANPPTFFLVTNFRKQKSWKKKTTGNRILKMSYSFMVFKNDRKQHQRFLHFFLIYIYYTSSQKYHITFTNNNQLMVNQSKNVWNLHLCKNSRSRSTSVIVQHFSSLIFFSFFYQLK